MAPNSYASHLSYLYFLTCWLEIKKAVATIIPLWQCLLSFSFVFESVCLRLCFCLKCIYTYSVLAIMLPDVISFIWNYLPPSLTSFFIFHLQVLSHLLCYKMSSGNTRPLQIEDIPHLEWIYRHCHRRYLLSG